MEASWLPVLVSAAVFFAIILLAAVCLDCGNKGPMVSIRQASEEYMPSTEFRIIHPSHTTTTLNSIASPSHLSPFPNSVDAGSQRHRSFTTETESNPSYENPGPESIESDVEDPGYITVLPDGQDRPSNASRASTPSSDAQHEYVNVKCKTRTPSTSTIEDTEYQNVEPLHGSSGVPPAVISELLAPYDNNEEESSDDDEGNYVNQPSIQDFQPAQCIMGRVNDL